jgi:ABC-type multidrug transport system fused ATPase/permease subunit
VKKTLVKLKWLLSQSKSVVFHLFIIIILGSIVSIVNVYRALVTKNFIDSATLGEKQLIIKWIIIFAVIICVEIIIRVLISILSTYCSGKISNNLQKKLYAHITYSEWMEHSKYHSVGLLTRITSDVPTVTNLLVNTLPNLISFSVMIITAFVALLYLEPTMAILSIIIFPVCALIGKFYGQNQKKIYIDIEEQEVKYRTFIQESIQNSIIVKSFCQEERNISLLNHLQLGKLKLLLKRSYINAISNTFIEIGAWASYFLVFAWGAFTLSKGLNAFGTLTALLQLFGNIQGPFLGFAQSLPQIINSIGASERLMEIEKLALENKSINSQYDENYPIGINLKNVCFNYKENSPVLKNISFEINPGDIVALVGPSGEGKTTLVRLLLSLIHPVSGEIFITQNNEKLNINRNFRNFISYVPQGNTLFSGTIKDNLLYGNSEATSIEIQEAAKLASAWEFIDNLDDKLSTIIGEKGIGLSEGQAQRLAIARAYLRNKPILILDEATSALDLQTEIKVLESIKDLSRKPICLIITHRPSALAICSKILELENGHISVHDKTQIPEIAIENSEKLA